MFCACKSVGLLGVVVALVTLASVGCGKRDNNGERQAKAGGLASKEADSGKVETTHEGWWCQEHGVPERLCSICMSAAAAKKKFKDNGDWCPEHDRALSQCFKCDPSKYKKFEDMYVAKYGKQPEAPPKEELEKN